MYPKSVIDNQIKSFLEKQFTLESGKTSEKRNTLHYGLPYIGHFSHNKKTVKTNFQTFLSNHLY